MGAIPIIGQTRTWKDIGFAGKPMTKPPAILTPSAQPEVVGWQIVLCGTRSDELPVSVMHVVDTARVAGDPFVAAMRVFSVMVDQFESYRNCDCVPHHPCLRHTPTQPGKPS